MIKWKRTIFLLPVLLFLLNVVYPIYLLAVSNETGVKIKFKVQLLNSSDNKVDVFISSNSFIGEDTQLSIIMAKNIVCSIFDCKGKDFLVKIYGDTPLLSGPSGGAAFATGMVEVLLHLPDKDVGITGTINPGGVIGPVGGVNYKVQAAKDLDLVIIPLGEKIYRDPLTNKTYNLSYPNVKEAGTLFDILRLVWRINIKLKTHNLSVPDWYKKTMKEIANDLCSKINYEVKDNESYYAQASFCFTKLINIYKENYSRYDLKELIQEETKLEEELNRLEEKLRSKFETINGLNELQLYMILYKRINDAKDNLKKLNETIKDILINGSSQEKIEQFINILSYTRARIDSIKEWSKFIYTMPKGVPINIERINYLCKENYLQVKSYYDYLEGLYASYDLPFHFFYLDNLMKKLDEYKEKNPILCLAYAKELKSNIDSILALTYLTKNNLPTFFNSTNKITKFYIERNKEFPVMAYAYWNYANFLAKKNDYISAINYNYLAMNLATMIFEINEKEKVPIIVEFQNKFNKETIFYLTIIFTFFFYFIMIVKFI
ncbi:MAG: S16 family serine protease [Nanoarchaeota archaeon]